jgi:hypothetical protein
VQDCDLAKGTIRIHQVIVLGRDKDRPKNNEERTVELCPRARGVLERQLALRQQYIAQGKIDHDFVFFKESGEPITCLKYVYTRWVHVVEKLHVRYRDPYNARHTFVSWSLMIGKNLLWCSRQFGHSVQVMLTKYGTWIEGATEADVQLIKQAIAREPTGATLASVGYPCVPVNPQKNATGAPLEQGWGRLSWRKIKHFNSLTGGADGTRTRDPRRDRPISTSASMSEEERAPHESRIYLFSFASHVLGFRGTLDDSLEMRRADLDGARALRRSPVPLRLVTVLSSPLGDFEVADGGSLLAGFAVAPHGMGEGVEP